MSEEQRDEPPMSTRQPPQESPAATTPPLPWLVRRLQQLQRDRPKPGAAATDPQQR